MPGDHLRKAKLMAQLRPAEASDGDEESDEEEDGRAYHKPVVKARYVVVCICPAVKLITLF